jgi:hypothetical protein
MKGRKERASATAELADKIAVEFIHTISLSYCQSDFNLAEYEIHLRGYKEITSFVFKYNNC